MKNIFHNKGTKERSVILLGCFVALWFNVAVCAQPLTLGDPVFQAAMSKTVASGTSYSPSTDGSVIQWLKADAMNLANNDPVSVWTNSIGLDATGAAPPTYKTAQKNGLPAVLFYNDGQNHYLATSNFSEALTQPFTVWVVFQLVESSPGDYIFVFDGVNSGNRAAFLRDGGTDKFDIFSGIEFKTGTPDTNWHIAKCVFNGASSSLTIDNGSPATGDAGSQSLDALLLGINQSLSLNPRVMIGEVIIQNTLPADSSGVFSYLNGRWAIY